MRKLLLFFVCFIYATCFGQNTQLIDSINNANKSAWEKAESDILSAYDLTDWAIKKSKEINYTNGIASSELNYGLFSQLNGDLELSLENSLSALNKVTKNPKLESKIHNQLGTLYTELQNYKEAFFHLKTATTINGNKNFLKDLCDNYINIGNIKNQIFEIDSSIYYYNKAIALGRKIKNDKIVHISLVNLGTIYGNLGETRLELQYYLESVESTAKNSNLRNQVYHNIATAYYDQKKLNKSKEYALKALAIAENNNFTQGIIQTTYLLSKIEELKRNYPLAFKYQEKTILFREQLLNESTLQKVTRIQLQDQFVQQQKIDSLKNQKAMDEMALENHQNEVLRKEQVANRNILLTISIIFMVVAALFITRIFRANKEVEIQRDKAIKEHEFADEQKKIAETKNKEILESINYAKRLQNAILPSKQTLNNLLPNSFIFYQPKDIVAGDFYWVETKNDLVYFATADCTGHGVPGALVSIVCANSLNQTLHEYNITEPNQILSKVTELVVKTFSNNEEDEIQDGMDIGLCCLDKKNNTITFSGANIPLWIVTKNVKNSSNYREIISENGNSKLIEIKGSKRPIGRFESENDFVQHTINLYAGDFVYMTSDGYPDQFGGERNKKYKTSTLRKDLVNQEDVNIQQIQLNIIENFNKWKSINEQVDDVCVFGIKIS